MKKMIYAVICVLAMMGTTGFSYENEKTSMDGYMEQAEQIESYYEVNAIDTSKLTYEQLTNRIGRVIVERSIGVVLNENKDGKILNTDDDYYNYISYRSIKCNTGDIVITYCLYNPENNYVDDIIARWDFVIDNVNNVDNANKNISVKGGNR